MWRARNSKLKKKSGKEVYQAFSSFSISASSVTEVAGEGEANALKDSVVVVVEQQGSKSKSVEAGGRLTDQGSVEAEGVDKKTGDALALAPLNASAGSGASVSPSKASASKCSGGTSVDYQYRNAGSPSCMSEGVEHDDKSMSGATAGTGGSRPRSYHSTRSG